MSISREMEACASVVWPSAILGEEAYCLSPGLQGQLSGRVFTLRGPRERWEAAVSEGTELPKAEITEEEGGSLPRPSDPLTTTFPLPLLRGLHTQVLDGHLTHTRFEAMPELESTLHSLSLFRYQMGLTQTFGEEVAQGSRSRTEEEGHVTVKMGGSGLTVRFLVCGRLGQMGLSGKGQVILMGSHHPVAAGLKKQLGVQ